LIITTDNLKSQAALQGKIRILPDILLTAARGKNGGAARLWLLARHFSPGGSGYIPAKALRRHVINDLQVKRGVYDIWLIRAQAIGLLTRQGINLKITGQAQAAVIVGLERVGDPGYIPVKALINKGWIAEVWAAWIRCKGLEKRPISRAAMRGMSGVIERSQRNYERLAKVINRPNYAVDKRRKGGGWVEYIRENEKRGAFAIGKAEVLAWRLPNSRAVGDNTERRGHGRTRRVNAQIADLLVNSGQDPQAIARLYCQCDKQVDKAQKKIKRLGRKGIKTPDWLYQATERVGFWDAIPA